MIGQERFPEKKRKRVTKGMKVSEEMKMTLEELGGLIKFISEFYTIKRTPRTGWGRAGLPLKITESVGEHESAVNKIGFLLAEKEGVNTGKVLEMLTWHDTSETRTGDIHEVAKRYLETVEPTSRAFEDQIRNLPERIGQKILELVREMRFGDSPEAIVARDADLLEAALQAKIYQEAGYKNTKAWLESAERQVQTDFAKRLLKEVRRMKNFTAPGWED